MNLPISGKLIIPDNLKPEEIVERIATIMISFNYNIIIDYKIYERLKEIAICPEIQSEQQFLKINSEGMNLMLNFSSIDSDYIFIEKLLKLNGNGNYCEKSEYKENFLFVLEEETSPSI